jgi:hypothetical protein
VAGDVGSLIKSVTDSVSTWGRECSGSGGAHIFLTGLEMIQ